MSSVTEPPTKPWQPPPEPHKPYVPYRRGTQLQIYRHTPPEPFGLDYAKYEGSREPAPMDMLSNTTLVDLCLRQPPSEGVTHKDSRSLEITDELKVREDEGAQIFLCRLDEEPEVYVGKVYDPLYYGFPNLAWPDTPRDVTYEADGDYSRETAAYQYLADQQFEGLGTEVPEYYGSWTFSMPLTLPAPTGVVERPVRMVLMEYIDGRTMLDINVARMTQAKRFDVITRVLETECRLRHIGLVHGDVSMRNIVVRGYDSPSDVADRVCYIDFNIAVIQDRTEFHVKNGITLSKPDRPTSPADLWWDSGFPTFRNWLPSEWDEFGKAWKAWLTEKYASSDTFEPMRGTEPKGLFGMDHETDASPPLGLDDEFTLGNEDMGSVSLPPPSPSSNATRERELPNHKRRRGDSDMDSGSPISRDMGHALESRMEAHHTPLGHISIGVKDYHAAKAFFTPVLQPLGLLLVFDSENSNSGSQPKTLGYGPSSWQELLNIFEYGEEASPPGRGCHVAFNAPTRQAVDDFHEKAVANGGICDGKPGLRPQYGPSYYAAFVISPDGWRLEAVCKDSPSTPVSPFGD